MVALELLTATAFLVLWGAALHYRRRLFTAEREGARQHEALERDRERRYRALTESIDDVVVRYDRDCRRTYVNPAWELVNGATAAQALGKSPTEMAPRAKPVAAEIEATLRRAMAEGRTCQMEFFWKDESGAQVWYELRATPEFDADGAVDGVLTVARDISARKRLETELHEKTLLHETLLDALRDAGIQLMMIENGHIVHVANRELAHRAGWSDAAIDARPPLLDIIHPDDRARVADNHRRRLAGEDVPTRYELALCGPGGERIEYEVAVALVPDSVPPRVVTVGWEIGERKRLEVELRRSEREFRAIVENSADLVFRYDRECRRTYVNPAVCKLFRRPAAALLGATAKDNALLADRDGYLAAIRKTFVTGEIAHVPIVFELDGGPIDYDVQLIPEHDEYGRIASVFGVARDVTALRDAERRAGEFLANAPGFIYIMRRDLVGRVSLPYASPGLEARLGVSRAALRESIEPLRARYHPDDRRRVEAAFAESAARLSPAHVEFRVYPPQGSELWLESHATPTVQANGEIQWHGIAFDITERKRAERDLLLLRRAIEQTSEGYFLMDEQWRVIDANAAACASLGLDRAELLGLTPLDFDPDITRDMMDALMAREPGAWDVIETRHHARDGRIFPVEISGSVFEDGGQRYAISIVRDITERKRIESTLRFVADPGKTGAADFLGGLVRHLAETLGVEYVVIDRLADQPGDAETVALWANGAIVPNLTYALAGTPCANVMDKRFCCYPRGVQALFPEDRLLVEMGVESYAGVPLWDSTGKPVGLVAVMGTRPFADETEIEQCLRLVAPRAAAELERAESERRLRASEREFRSLAENSPDAIIRYDREGRILYLNGKLIHRLGLSGADEVIGRRPGEIWPDGRFDTVVAATRRALESGKAQEIELHWVTAVGEHQDDHLIVAPERDEAGRIVGTLVIGRDVTRVREAERRLAHFIDNLPGLAYTFRLSPDGAMSFPFVSAGIRDIYGIEPEAAMADMTAIHGLAHPDDRPRIEAAIASSARDLSPFRIESRACCPGHPERWLDVRSVPERQPDGGIMWYGLMLDITTRKRMEEELRRHHEELRALVENTPDTVARYDRGCRRVYANPALLAGLAASADRGMNRTPTETFPGSPEAADYEAALRAALESGEEGQFALAWRGPRGRVWSHIRIVPERDGHGDVASVLAIGRDITAIVQTEEQLMAALEFTKGIIDAIPDLLFEMDREGRYLHVWAHDADLLVAEKERLIGNTAARVLPADAAGTVMAALREAEEKGSSFGKSIRLALPVGERWFELSVSRKPGKHSADPHFLMLSRDITERKAALAEAERLARLRGAFMAQMSHELRTPLNAILGFAQLMQREDNLPGEVRDWADLIRDSGEHLLALINQVLDFAKIEAGKLTLQPEDIRLAGFLETLAAAVRVEAAKKRLDFALVAEPDLPAFVRSDPLRLRQILLNLLSNAVKFTKQGRVELRIGQPAPERLRFEVIDTGPGIDAENLENIFYPFEQLEASGRTNEGTGLGLAISRNLARLMGGDIAVESVPGVGSRFILELDAALATGGGEAPDDASAAAPAAAEEPPIPEHELPPAEDLEELLGLARDGYLRRIAVRAAELEASHTAFAFRLGRLARAYRAKESIDYLERCLAAKRVEGSTP